MQWLANRAFAGAFAADDEALLAGEGHALRRRFDEIFGKMCVVLGNVIAKKPSEHKLFLLRAGNEKMAATKKRQKFAGIGVMGKKMQ